MAIDAKVEINANDVNRMVADAVLTSAIGESLKKAVEDYKKKFGEQWSFQRHIEEAVDRQVKDQVGIIVSTELRPVIEKIVREKVTEDMVNKAVDKIWNTLNRGY